MSIPYQELRFSKKEMRILKRINRQRKISLSKIDKNMFGKYLFLFRYNLITIDESGNFYKLSDKGEMYLRYRRESEIQFYLPLALSIIAIIISIISLLKQ